MPCHIGALDTRIGRLGLDYLLIFSLIFLTLHLRLLRRLPDPPVVVRRRPRVDPRPEGEERAGLGLRQRREQVHQLLGSLRVGEIERMV